MQNAGSTKADLCVCASVRLSVRDTLVLYQNKNIESHFSPADGPNILFFERSGSERGVGIPCGVSWGREDCQPGWPAGTKGAHAQAGTLQEDEQIRTSSPVRT